MDELPGIPEWLAKTLFVSACIAGLLVLGAIVHRRATKALAAKRPNPTRDEFMLMMAKDVSPAASEFLWKTVLFYIKPHLTPHPDDDLIEDLPIDHDDIGMDWPRDWAEQQDFHESNLPDWPRDWAVTVRNFGRWLDMGPV